jgi:hypothetical protein
MFVDFKLRKEDNGATTIKKTEGYLNYFDEG